VRAAVTGATGFVGSHLVEALVARGDAVSVLARDRRRVEAASDLGCRVVVGDLADAVALDTVVAGVDVVFHVAGVVAARSKAEFFAVNEAGTARVARAACAAGVARLVFVSSLAVTGPSVPGRALREDEGPGPVTTYGRSKAAGEAAVRASGAPFTIVRPPAVYGRRDRAFLALFRFARRGVVPLLGDGAHELCLVHADDLARALVAAATSPRTRGRTYHAAHLVPVTQRGLARAVGRAMGRTVRLVTLPPLLVRGVLAATGAVVRASGRAPLLDADKAHEILAPAWTCSSDALREDVGWQATVSLDEGLADTARSYRESGWL